MQNDYPQDQKQSSRNAERRQKRDWVVKSVSVIAFIGWISAIVSLVYTGFAQPETENMFTRIFGGDVITTWNSRFVNGAFISILISFFVCLIGLLVNMTRHRRKTDRFNKSIITLGMISFVFAVVFLLAFYI
ncbi:MAG: hypothetical protein FWG32_05790 [Oscillospiraceae bacterium]|nr:hypothetical protein [Oscillospiraceae bacterium]